MLRAEFITTFKETVRTAADEKLLNETFFKE
jgi:hypothetical protein